MLVEQGPRIGDVKVRVVVDIDVTVCVKNSKVTRRCDGVFGGGKIEGA